jgi:hypothetical protein
MSKLGKKMIAGAKEAVAIARGDLQAIRGARVTPSCGCVFCDLKMPTVVVDGVAHHEARDAGKRVLVLCTRSRGP